MAHYAIMFLVLALISGFFGFWGVAGSATMVAKVLFFLFVIGFVVSLFMNGSPKYRS
jgi:uncharacterized membrane protein YtjA (UPF0391 family)